MNPYLIIVIVAAIVSYGFGYFSPLVLKEARRAGKVRIIFWDPDGGVFKVGFHQRRNGNEVTVGKGAAAQTYILEARARQPGRWPTWLIHPRYGWNWVPLSDSETVDRDALLQRLAISNPASYHNQISVNKPRHGFRANDPDDKSWITTAIIAGAIILGLILLGVGVLVFSSFGGGGGAEAAAVVTGGP